MAVCSQLAQADSLNWNGTNASHTWDTDSANTVWTNSSTAAPAAFATGDDVAFAVPADPVSSTVAVGSAIEAGRVTVDGDYTIETTAESSISGAFASTADGKVTKTGETQLTLVSTNAETNGFGLAVAQGNLALAGAGSFTQLESMAQDTGLTIAEAADIAFTGAATGTDVLLLGKLTLGENSSFNSVRGAGTLAVAEGKTLNVATSAAIGTLLNGGDVTVAGTLLVDNEATMGGNVTAANLVLNNGGTFGQVTTETLTLGTRNASVAAQSIGSGTSAMELQVARILRGSGNFALVTSEALGDTVYTLGSETIRNYYDNGYIATLTRSDNALTLNVETTDNGYYWRHTSSGNGQAGGRLLDAAFGQVDPQANRAEYSDLASALDAMDVYIANGDAGATDALAAAVAGPGVTALNSAFRTQMERQMREIRNRLTTMNGGMPCDTIAHCDPKAPAPKELRYTLWANAEIDYQNQHSDGSGPGFKLNSIGGTAGFTALAAKDLTLGAAFTGLAGRLSSKGYGSDASGDLDAYYANIFGRYDSGCWSHSLIGTAGFADVSLDRRVNYYGGGYTAHGSTDGLGLGVMYEVARTFRISQDYMTSAWWQPVFNVAYIHSEMDSYTETGTDAALRVGKQESNNVIFGLGARMQTVVGQNLFNSPALMEARVLGKAIAGSRRGKADVGIPGIDRTVGVRGSERGPLGVEVGLGFSIPLGERCGAIITDCTAEFGNQQRSVNGTLGYRIDF